MLIGKREPLTSPTRRDDSTYPVRLRPWRSAILHVGGDKSGDWQGWSRRAVPHAEELYEDYLKEREAEEAR